MLTLVVATVQEGRFDFVFSTACYYDQTTATPAELREIELQGRSGRTSARIYDGDARSAPGPWAEG